MTKSHAPSNASPPFHRPGVPHLYFSIVKRLIKFAKKPVDVARLGARWRLYPRDWIDNRMIAGQPFEFDQLNFALATVNQHKIDLFIDCGANMGLYTVVLGVHAPNITEIHAFEPVAVTFARLQHHVELNHLADKATCHDVALSDRHGITEIKFDPSSSGVATVQAAPAGRRRSYAEMLPIKTAPLDDSVNANSRRVFIKVDVEGHTLPVLKGMERLLKSNHCILQVEITGADPKIASYLSSLGYREMHCIEEDHYFEPVPA